MMGGGDTRIGKHTVVVRLRPPRHGSGYGAVWAEGSKIHVADSKEKGARVGSRVYNVSAALPAFATQRDLYNAVGVGALDTLWDGFNSSIIAMGQVGTGKTHCLFGSPISADDEDLCTQLLTTLFSWVPRVHRNLAARPFCARAPGHGTVIHFPTCLAFQAHPAVTNAARLQRAHLHVGYSHRCQLWGDRRDGLAARSLGLPPFARGEQFGANAPSLTALLDVMTPGLPASLPHAPLLAVQTARIALLRVTSRTTSAEYTHAPFLSRPLLTHGCCRRGAGQACVAIESLSDALQAIAVGRSRSENWTQDPVKGTYAALPNRAHAFVRVTLYDARRRRVSALHLVVRSARICRGWVRAGCSLCSLLRNSLCHISANARHASRGGQDLIGSCPLAGAKSSDNAFTQRPGSDRLRRAHSQQIISLNRIISDLASKHEKKGVAVSMSPAELKVGAYKDSKLNKFIAPLIAGNNQTTILTTVSTDADDLLDSLNTLRCTSRALSISTACHRRLNVAPGEIGERTKPKLANDTTARGRLFMYSNPFAQ